MLERLKIEMYRSIYGDNDFILNESTIKSRGNGAPPRHHMADTKVFFEREPYFLRFHKLLKQYQRSGLSVARKMKTARSLEEAASDSMLSATFSKWKQFVADFHRKHHGIQQKMRQNRKRQSSRMKRLHFRDWKATVSRKRMSELKREKVAFEERYEDTLRSSILLLKKNNVLQFEISALKNILNDSRSGDGVDSRNRRKFESTFSEIKVFQMELKVRSLSISLSLSLCQHVPWSVIWSVVKH